MRYQHLLKERVSNSLKAKWAKWLNVRLLREYCRAQLEETELPKHNHLVKDLLFVLACGIGLFWFIPSLMLTLGGMAILTVVVFYQRYLRCRKEDLRLKKACFAKISFREYENRLEKASLETILQILRAEIDKQFRLGRLVIKQGILEGEWQKKNLAIVYLEASNGLVAGRDVLGVIRRCYHEGMTIVRIFSNGEYEEGVSHWNQLFNVDLRLYNGKMLAYFFKNTLLFPSVSEVTGIIEREKSCRQRKLGLIKKELLQKTRFSGYLLYSLFLLMLAWYNIGIVSLNVLAGLILLGFALFVIIKNIFFQGKKDEQESDFALYFGKNGF